MNNYFIDLNVFAHQNIFYTESSNIERINYLFGEININLIVPKIIEVSEIDHIFLKEINYNVIEAGNSVSQKKKIVKESDSNFILLTANLFFITSLVSIIFAFKRFKLIYVGSISNSYFYSKYSLTNIIKYLLALITEFICFLFATKIYAAGGNLPNKLYRYFFKKKSIKFNTKYFKTYEYSDHNFKKRYDCNTIVFLGLVSSQKGMDENIRFINKINSISENKYKLIIIGKKINDDYEKFLCHKNISYRGYLKDPTEIKHILMNSKYLILQSKHEGMARAPLEAMYYSLPVLTNGVGTFNYCNSKNSIINMNPEDLAISAHKLSFAEYCQMSELALQTSKLFNGSESPIIR